MRLQIIANPDMPYHKSEDYESIMVPVLRASGHSVSMSTNHADLNAEVLSNTDVLLLYTTGGHLEPAQEQALVDFVRRGGGLVGIHCAADSFKDSQVYMDLICGRFVHHPAHQVFHIQIRDSAHPITAGLEDFDVYDELYLMETQPQRYHLLVSCPWEGADRDVAWVREEGQGRVYYCSLGHTPEALAHPSVQQLHLRGCEWAARLL